MILERYINRTNTKITVKKVGKQKPELEESKNLDEKYMAKMQGDEGPRSMSIHIEPAKSKDTQLIQHRNSRVGVVEIKEDQPKITLE